MELFQCDLIVTRTVHVKIEADNKKDAAAKAYELASKEKCTLVLWGKVESAWVGPEEQDVDLDVDVSKALPGPYSYWDESEMITVKEAQHGKEKDGAKN